ncbi:MAG: hypothetical protein WAU75_14950, partial [Solirubrobacteraceae bacterium]
MCAGDGRCTAAPPGQTPRRRERSTGLGFRVFAAGRQKIAREAGAAFLGYTKLYGQVPGGQAEFLRVPQAQFGPIKVPDGPADDRF